MQGWPISWEARHQASLRVQKVYLQARPFGCQKVGLLDKASSWRTSQDPLDTRSVRDFANHSSHLIYKARLGGRSISRLEVMASLFIYFLPEGKYSVQCALYILEDNKKPTSVLSWDNHVYYTWLGHAGGCPLSILGREAVNNSFRITNKCQNIRNKYVYLIFFSP